MSLMGTLGKVAMGVIVAKGVGKVMGGAGGAGGGLGGLLGGLTGGSSSSGGGLGGLLGGLTGGNNAQAGSSGGLGGLLGGLTGGSQGGSSGGLGGMLGGLMGGNNAQSGQGGGLGDLMAGLAGQGQSGAAAGGLGGLLGSLGGASAPQQQGSSPTDFGKMFNEALQGKEPEQVSETDEQHAAVLLRAMINAAKSDGELDSEEQRKITEHLGDVSEEEAAFVRHELAAPMDLDGLVASVPSGLEQQVYLMSLMAIDLDSKEEAVYLDSLRKGLNMSEQASNHIHDQLGAPKLYA